MTRAEYVSLLNEESAIVLDVVRANPGMKVSDLQRSLEEAGYSVMLPRASMVKLWDEGKLEVTPDRKLMVRQVLPENSRTSNPLGIRIDNLRHEVLPSIDAALRNLAGQAAQETVTQSLQDVASQVRALARSLESLAAETKPKDPDLERRRAVLKAREEAVQNGKRKRNGK